MTEAGPHAHDAVVYDLDGTLVRLVVDWEQVATEVAETLADAGVDVADADLWGMLDLADATGHRATVESVLTDHECAGARRSQRLGAADALVEAAVPAGVCSLNAERACRIALETHGLDGHVAAVVGRDSIEARKPDPEPLLETLRLLGVSPDRALFVGDSETDAVAASRAGVQFRYVDDRSPGG